jgi:hypothetical protein
VSKHTTCDDVDEDGIKRLVEVPVHRCRRRVVDVSAVLLSMNKACKNRNPNTHVNSQKFGAKRTHKCCQSFCYKITPEFVSKGQMDVKRGNMMLRGVKLDWSDVYRL